MYDLANCFVFYNGLFHFSRKQDLISEALKNIFSSSLNLGAGAFPILADIGNVIGCCLVHKVIEPVAEQ